MLKAFEDLLLSYMPRIRRYVGSSENMNLILTHPEHTVFIIEPSRMNIVKDDLLAATQKIVDHDVSVEQVLIYLRAMATILTQHVRGASHIEINRIQVFINIVEFAHAANRTTKS